MVNQDMKKVLDKAAERMELCAKHFKDKGASAYTAALHSSAAGIAIARAFEGDDALELTPKNVTTLFHALYNHSAWRQKWEKAGLFAKASERSLDGLVEDLDSEGI